jgi:hypothetical protein
MPHTLTLSLTDTAQRAALVAGQPAQRVQTYEVPLDLLPRLLALEWARVDADGRAMATIPGLEYLATRRPADAAEALVWAEAIHAARAEAEVQRQAELAASRAAWATLPLDERVRSYHTGRHPRPWSELDPALTAEVEAVIVAQRRAERAAEAEAQRHAAEQTAAKTTHLRRRLGELEPALAAQWDDGLLCRDAATRRVAAAGLDPIAPPAARQPLCADTDCPCGQDDVTCLPPEVYQRLVALRARLPEGATLDHYRRIRPHHGDLDQPMDAVVDERYTATLTIHDGPLTFTRRIEL